MGLTAYSYLENLIPEHQEKIARLMGIQDWPRFVHLKGISDSIWELKCPCHDDQINQLECPIFCAMLCFANIKLIQAELNDLYYKCGFFNDSGVCGNKARYTCSVEGEYSHLNSHLCKIHYDYVVTLNINVNIIGEILL